MFALLGGNGSKVNIGIAIMQYVVPGCTFDPKRAAFDRTPR
jgi:hypothetical protein